MTDTLRKRAERQRRREAGEVRVEVWLSAPNAEYLDAYCKACSITRRDALIELLEKGKDHDRL